MPPLPQVIGRFRRCAPSAALFCVYAVSAGKAPPAWAEIDEHDNMDHSAMPGMKMP